MDSKDGLRGQVFTRRALILSGMGGLAFAGLAGRLYMLQVVNGEHYTRLAERNRIDERLLAPRRGTIYDRFGVELAINRQNYRLLLVPEATPDVDALLERLKGLVELTDGQLRRIQRDIARNTAFVPVTVAENLDWEVFAYLNANLLDFPGIQPDVGDTRVYPYPEVLSHVVGYVGLVSERDVAEHGETEAPELRIPGFRIGKEGIEAAFEEDLRGRAGQRHVEVNASGRLIREITRTPGESGEDLVLTIDFGLQKFAADRVKGESAAITVMDVHTGDLLALVSEPGFDSNLFNRGVPASVYRQWQNDPFNPLYNKATKGLFPPGSTFKMVVALAALESGLVGPNDTVWCRGRVELGVDSFHCWKREGHGTVNMHRSIKESCDIYYYEIARRVGIEKIADVAMRFGLGSDYGFVLPHTYAGTVPTPEFKRARKKGAWQQYDTLMTGIGQGYLQATPLQLAVMTARLVNGGREVNPRLVRAVGERLLEPPPAASLNADPRHLDIVLKAMNAVVNEPSGTALGSRLRGEGLSMGGKTGTAQVRKITLAERVTGVRKNEEMPWELRDHALFCGYGPIDAPRYAVSVVVEHGGGGSSTAAPIARDVLREALERDPARQPAFRPLARGLPAREGPDPERGQG
ncbi:MAG: penicillin-binding protein 2 [Alphaproteobacteria bacterium]|nr:penicillin-binding protein 2 [Alphaproteobacteria bacterium]